MCAWSGVLKIKSSAYHRREQPGTVHCAWHVRETALVNLFDLRWGRKLCLRLGRKPVSSPISSQTVLPLHEGAEGVPSAPFSLCLLLGRIKLIHKHKAHRHRRLRRIPFPSSESSAQSTILSAGNNESLAGAARNCVWHHARAQYGAELMSRTSVQRILVAPTSHTKQCWASQGWASQGARKRDVTNRCRSRRRSPACRADPAWGHH